MTTIDTGRDGRSNLLELPSAALPAVPLEGTEPWLSTLDPE